MFVIAGVTGHVGSVAATELLAKGQKIKVIVRNADKGTVWSKAGAEVAVGKLEDEAFLTTAFKGAKGAFLLLPPDWTVTEVLAAQKTMGAAIAASVQAAKLPHVVLLSSNGADVPEGTGPIKGLYHFENALRATGTQLSSVRAGMFMENVAQGIGAAKGAGIYPNFMPSQDMAMPMIATKDIGMLVAECLIAGPKTENIDLHGPSYSPKQIAEKIGTALGKTIPIVDVPQAGWLDALLQGGVPRPWAEAYNEMYQGMLSGKITPKGDRAVAGKTSIDEVIKNLV